MSELTIDVVSDVVCPWCFIGKRRLEAALRELKNERPDVAPRIRWLPFFLNPDTLEAGEPYRPFLERKFGGPEKLAQIWTQISEAGRTAGIDFAFERIETRANTLKAHRLIHRAQARGEADALVERLFAAQFLHGENVGDAAVLARLAAECGEDEAETLAYLRSDVDAAAVRAGFERAQQMGITGVPFFILAGRYGVGGAQPPELMLGTLRRSLAPA
ncbi:MAG: DsbA family oxidoreductase [Rhodocyclaceae bacterium]|jgi:predicted DsbA family dithiol-disulfide isomerase|nr:DsbA family oxidoreductase [Rhodocyclaceae bacterium]